MLEVIEWVRWDSEVDSDFIYICVGVRCFLDNCFEVYLDELIVKGLLIGRCLFDCKICWSKY